MRRLRALPPPVFWAVVLVGLGGACAAVSVFESSTLRGPTREALAVRDRARLLAAAERFRTLAASLEKAADRAAALPEAKASLRGERAALADLFRSLERMGAEPGAPAAAIHALPLAKVAWARPTADLRGLETRVGTRRGLHVLEGSVTTTLLATSPVTEGQRVLGMATAEAPLRVERHISNEYLQDFDRIAGPDAGLRVEYGVLDPPPEGATGLRDGAGRLLAVVSAVEPPGGPGGSRVPSPWRRAAATLICLGLLILTFVGAGGLPGLAATAATARLAVGGLGLPWPFATPAASPFPPGPDALLSFLEAATAFLLAASLCDLVLRRAPGAPRPALSALAAALSVPVIGIGFTRLGRVSAESTFDLAVVSLFPRSEAHLGLQASLLLTLATVLALLVGLLALGGPIPRTASGRLLRSAVFAALGTLSVLFWPRSMVGLPLLPAVLLFVTAALLAGTHTRWRASWREASAGVRALTLLVATAALAALLHPSLVHFGEKAQRARIEGEYARLVRDQAAWRAEELERARLEVDALEVLEDPGSRPLVGLEELAFSIWSDSRLNGAGVASAVELQDRSGALISRFALDLPALLAAVPPRTLPPDDAWVVTRERLQVGSAERNVLYARRRLRHHGEVHGAVHLYLGADPWDLPFLPRRDPYTALFRSAPARPGREEALALTVFARPDGVAFTSADRPPALSAALRERLAATPEGLWTTLPVDGRPHHTFLLPVGDVVYALSYPRLGARAFLAGLVEAVAGLGGMALLAVVAVLLVRTLSGRKTLSLPALSEAIARRFALRLFLSFVAAAVVPVAALELAFRGYVADRLRRESEEQALERAAVAQRAVNDYAFYQRAEGPDRAAVTNTLLVWVAHLIKGDVDVFGQGRLVASSKRELFSSGLLPTTAPGPVFRALTLEGAPSVLRTEGIGEFSALVAYVPVRLDGVEPGILGLPLAGKEREARATLEEFDRSMRLASLAFLALAAGLALSLSRRLSEPVRDLTRATRRVAAGDLGARVATERKDELRDLVDSFNQMASDLDRQRRDLERSNRLAAWADMARQVAHEVKNPLTPIQLSAEHLQRVWRDRAPDFGGTLETCTDTILRQVRTLRGIVTEFSAFARPPEPEPVPADLPTLVGEALRPYTLALPPGVALDLRVEALPSLHLDRRLVTRAVVNLVENALHAVGERGRIEVRVGPSSDGQAAEVVVSDDGPGLGEEGLAQAFEPFFSTKPSGSGLGLALVRRVAEDHGGSARLESALGGPTRAIFSLPLSRPAGGAGADDGPRNARTDGCAGAGTGA